MKLIDEVAALSSVDALESLCAPIHDGRRTSITQNLNALRQQLTVPDEAITAPAAAWYDYARRSGLLSAEGVAPKPAQAQTAYNAFTFAWNAAIHACERKST